MSSYHMIRAIALLKTIKNSIMDSDNPKIQKFPFDCLTQSQLIESKHGIPVQIHIDQGLHFQCKVLQSS